MNSTDPRLENLLSATSLSPLAFQYAVSHVRDEDGQTPNYLKSTVLYILKTSNKARLTDEALLASHKLGPLAQSQLDAAV